MKNQNNKVSVITVCHNAQSTISRTIKSVLMQTYLPLEYIIIDGKSSDHTMDVVNAFADEFKEKNIEYKFISEADRGIYDAMNKGIILASGEWVNFMNADDNFHDADTIEKVFSCEIAEAAGVLYGDEYIRDQNGDLKLNKRDSDMKVIQKYLPFCHQSAFVRSSLYKSKLFNLKYTYTADYDFFLWIYYVKNERFAYIPVPVSDYNKCGASYANALKAFCESREFRVKYNFEDNKEYLEKIKDILRYIKLWYRLKKDS